MDADNSNPHKLKTSDHLEPFSTPLQAIAFISPPSYFLIIFTLDNSNLFQFPLKVQVTEIQL